MIYLKDMMYLTKMLNTLRYVFLTYLRKGIISMAVGQKKYIRKQERMECIKNMLI